MIWILGFYSLTVILFLIIITSERKESKRYGLAIDYLETYGDRRYISYRISDYKRKEREAKEKEKEKRELEEKMEILEQQNKELMVKVNNNK